MPVMTDATQFGPGLPDIERKRIEQVIREREYRASIHLRRWERRAQYEKAAFERSVDERKPMFDCLRWVMMSAAFFGIGWYLYLSSPLNEFCQRDGGAAALPPLALAVWTLVWAADPIIRYSRYRTALAAPQSLTEYPLPRLRRERLMPPDLMVHVGVVTLCLFFTSIVVAEQIATRAQQQKCITTPPL
jgi:hypothetical protein